MADTLSTYDRFAHDIFPTVKDLQAFALIDHPVLALLNERKHSGPGRKYGYPALQQGAIGLSATRAGAQAAYLRADTDAANFLGEEFLVPYFKYAGGFRISELQMATTAGAGGVPDGAYLEKYALDLKSIVQEFGARQEAYFVGRSGKSLGLSTANGGTTNLAAANGTVQLADPLQIMNFRIGQVLQFSLNDGSSPGHALLATLGTTTINGVTTANIDYIVSINYDAGSFVISRDGTNLGDATLNTNAGANPVFIFNVADFQGSATPNAMSPGLAEWITASTPSATPFFTVVRSNDTRLAGWRMPAAQIAGEQLDGVIRKMLERGRQIFGQSGELVFPLNTQRWSTMVNIAQARGYRMLNGEDAQFGYQYIEVVHGNMRAKLVDTPCMPLNDLYALDMKDDGWVVRSLDGWPKIMSGDGLQMLRSAAEDEYEFRIRAYFHTAPTRINRNGRADLTNITL
jgi:hypothetical protein